METLASRVASESVWDQSAYNQEIFRLALGEKTSAAVSARVMSHLCFMNTKTLFKHMRREAALIDPSRHRPVSVHVNYHPEKEARMVSIRQFYHEGQHGALDGWNGGEGRATGGCRDKVGVHQNQMPKLTAEAAAGSKIVQSVLAAAEAWTWRGAGPCRFEPGGAFSSPFGVGTWGVVPSPWRKDALHVVMGEHTYLLMFLSEKWAFVALRCADEEVSFGQLTRPDVPSKRLVR